MPPSFLDILNRENPTIRCLDGVKDDKFRIPAQEMKPWRDFQMTVCSFCSKSQREKLICGKCKVAAYCSKECQKKQWPSHKLVCQDSNAAAKFKFVSTLMGNINIDISLMEAFVLTFKLHENMILDQPLIVRCDLVIDATDLQLIFRLAARKQTPEDFPDGVQGMIQIKSFTPLDATVAMDARRRKIWEQAKTTNHLLDRNSPVGTNATGLIDFHMEGTSQVLTVPIHIHHEVLAVAAGMAAGKDVVYPGTGQTVHICGSPMVSIGFINGHIHDDEKNELRLRSHMPKEALYKYVGNNINRQHMRMLPTNVNMAKNSLLYD